MDLTLTLDATSAKPLQVQLFDEIREIILEGKLRAGMALPPSQVLAERLGISRNTVIAVYERLGAEGYVKARGTAGLFVEPMPPDSLLLVQRSDQPLMNRSIPDAAGEPLLREKSGSRMKCEYLAERGRRHYGFQRRQKRLSLLQCEPRQQYRTG